MKYYLCGPIDSIGDPAKNKTLFKLVTQVLRGRNYQIVSPLETGADELFTDWTSKLKMDMKHLLECEAIILLPGWPQSKGAKAELQIAMSLNMEVYYYRTNTDQLMSMNY